MQHTKLHINIADLLLSINVILVHLCQSGSTAIAGAIDITDGFRYDPFTFFSCRIFDQN